MYTLYKGGRTQRQTVNNGGWGNMKYYSQPPSPSLDLPCAPPSWICVSDLSRKSSNYTKTSYLCEDDPGSSLERTLGHSQPPTVPGFPPATVTVDVKH